MAAQLHLAFNHFPFVALVIGTIFLLLSFVPGWGNFRRSALFIFVLCGLFSLPAYFTGEGAEDVLRSNPDFPRALIHNHEEWAEIGFIATLVLAVSALAVLWWERKKELAKSWYFLLVVAALFVSVLMGRIGHLGGLVSHPEIRGQSMP